MATWTSMVNVAYQAILSSTFINTLLENTRFLKEQVDARPVWGAWQNIGFTSKFSVVSGYPCQYRVSSDGWCELRGLATCSSAVATAWENFATSMPNVTGGSATVGLIAAGGQGAGGPDGPVYFSPRVGGALQIKASTAAVFYITLDGVRYRTTATTS